MNLSQINSFAFKYVVFLGGVVYSFRSNKDYRGRIKHDSVASTRTHRFSRGITKITIRKLINPVISFEKYSTHGLELIVNKVCLKGLDPR